MLTEPKAEVKTEMEKKRERKRKLKQKCIIITFVLRQLPEVVPRSTGKRFTLSNEAFLHSVDAADDDDKATAHVNTHHIAVSVPPALDRQIRPAAHQRQNSEYRQTTRSRRQAHRAPLTPSNQLDGLDHHQSRKSDEDGGPKRWRRAIDGRRHRCSVGHHRGANFDSQVLSARTKV